MAADVVGVDLGHDQRHVVLHPEGAGVVHEHRAGAHDGRRKPPGQIGLGRAEHDVHALEGRVGGLLDHHLAAGKGQLRAGAAGAGQRLKRGDGELALLEHLEHFATDGAGRTKNGNIELFHRFHLISLI